MADYGTVQSPKIICRQLTSSIFSSPNLFGFVSKGSDHTESAMRSPTSILDTKPFCAVKNPLWSHANTPKAPESKNPWERLGSRRVGLGLVDALIDEKPDSNLSKSARRMVLLGSQLQIQVPPLPSPVLSLDESPKSPGDFGIKTRNSHVGSSSSGLSPSPAKKSPSGSLKSGALSSLSASEMELSEEYTRVISYGPNPRTTHIFDDCIVESCCGVVKLSESGKESGLSSSRSMSPFVSFLSFCCTCKKNLVQGNEVYMCRGEKAFCSSECRDKEMVLDEEEEEEEKERLETSDPYDVSGTSS